MDPLVRDLYKRFLIAGRHYPQGLSVLREKVKKEFDKLRKIKKFENFTIEVEVEVKPEGQSEESEEEIEEVGCGCCDQCNGQEGCECCQDCNCSSEVQEVEQSNPENDVKVMNISDFINSIANQ